MPVILNRLADLSSPWRAGSLMGLTSASIAVTPVGWSDARFNVPSFFLQGCSLAKMCSTVKTGSSPGRNFCELYSIQNII